MSNTISAVATLTTDRGQITALVEVRVNQWKEAQRVNVRRPTENTSGWSTESAMAAVRLAVEDGRIKIAGVA